MPVNVLDDALLWLGVDGKGEDIQFYKTCATCVHGLSLGGRSCLGEFKVVTLS